MIPPMKTTVTKVKQDVADAIKNLHELLRRDFGVDYSFSVNGNGHTIAKHNVTGVQDAVVADAPVAEETAK